MKGQATAIKTHGTDLSKSLIYIWFFYMAAICVWGLLFALLSHFLPFIVNDWVLFFPWIITTVLLVCYMVFSFRYTVTLTEETIVRSWLGIPLCKYSVSDLQIFCAVGDEREDLLCLTSRTVEEMAQLEERKLLRSFISKHDVPFLKKRADWQDVLARKYLNRLRRSPLGSFRDKKTLFMALDLGVQQQIRCLYPNLPYKNYTGITKNKAYFYFNKAAIPYFGMPTDLYFAEFQNDHIILRTKKQIKRRIPFADIKTIVRVEIFRPGDKYFPHHLPVLFLSVYQPEEMAKRARRLENDPILQAYRYAEREAMWWTAKREDCCNLPYTEETVAKLRRLCGHAQWIDISDGWLLDSP